MEGKNRLLYHNLRVLICVVKLWGCIYAINFATYFRRMALPIAILLRSSWHSVNCCTSYEYEISVFQRTIFILLREFHFVIVNMMVQRQQ